MPLLGSKADSYRTIVNSMYKARVGNFAAVTKKRLLRLYSVYSICKISKLSSGQCIVVYVYTVLCRLFQPKITKVGKKGRKGGMWGGGDPQLPPAGYWFSWLGAGALVRVVLDSDLC